MPINQFLANKNGEIADSVSTYIYNNNDSLNNFNFYDLNFKLKDLSTNVVYDNLDAFGFKINQSERQKVFYLPKASAIPSINKPLKLKSDFYFKNW